MTALPEFTTYTVEKMTPPPVGFTTHKYVVHVHHRRTKVEFEAGNLAVKLYHPSGWDRIAANFPLVVTRDVTQIPSLTPPI